MQLKLSNLYRLFKFNAQYLGLYSLAHDCMFIITDPFLPGLFVFADIYCKHKLCSRTPVGDWHQLPVYNLYSICPLMLPAHTEHPAGSSSLAFIIGRLSFLLLCHLFPACDCVIMTTVKCSLDLDMENKSLYKILDKMLFVIMWIQEVGWKKNVVN